MEIEIYTYIYTSARGPGACLGPLLVHWNAPSIRTGRGMRNATLTDGIVGSGCSHHRSHNAASDIAPASRRQLALHRGTCVRLAMGHDQMPWLRVRSRRSECACGPARRPGARRPASAPSLLAAGAGPPAITFY